MFSNFRCPHGGNCIDPGYPSDCEVNSRCISFSSPEEKAEFDAKPDLFEIVLNNKSIRFKNGTQLKFFLTDSPHWKGGKFFVLSETFAKVEIKLEDL